MTPPHMQPVFKDSIILSSVNLLYFMVLNGLKCIDIIDTICCATVRCLSLLLRFA